MAQVIRRLRDLGMGLEEIGAVIRAPDVGSRNDVIGTHLQRMEDQLDQTRETVASLRALLEGGAATIEVSYRTLPSASVLAVSTDVSGDDMHAWLDEAFASLRASVESSGPARSGPDGALFSSELLEEEFGSLVAFVPVAGEGARVLPETEYAIAVHVGAFEDLDRTYGALGTAVAERAIGVQGPIRENYVVGAFDTSETDRHRSDADQRRPDPDRDRRRAVPRRGLSALAVRGLCGRDPEVGAGARDAAGGDVDRVRRGDRGVPAVRAHAGRGAGGRQGRAGSRGSSISASGRPRSGSRPGRTRCGT